MKDCIFINNTATGFGGAISTGYDGTTGQNVKISNSYFEGNAAPIGGAITTHGNDITVDNSTFLSNKAADNGGAVYVVDDGITILNSNFGNNSAKNYAGAIYVKGNNVKIQNATFVNNSAHFAGAVRVEGNYVNVLNATFIGNKAISDGVSKSQAGALGISGNNVNIDSSYFANNTAEGDAGAIGVKGSHIKVTNSQFYSNHANPFNNDLNTGLGGAIYTMGNNVTYDNAIFRYNTAVNGSALFVEGVASLKNIVFYRNQAYTYALPIIVQNPKNPYGVTVNVTVVIIGGNNIANAIHHVGQLNDISFDNVTYLFNVNGTIMNRTTGADELHPVDGVENSKNGTLIYRDERENTQLINPIVIYDEDGNIIYNETLISSIYGDVRFSLSGLAPGNYTIKAEHPEDLFYKAIKNETNFEVVGFVDLDVDITTDKNYYGLDEEVEWTISLTNHGPHTDNNCYVNGIKLEDIIGFTPSKGTFDAATGIWKVGKLAKNEVVTLKVKTKTTSLGTVTLTVNAVNSTEDTNISNNVATKTIHIQELPKVVPTKDVNVTNPNYGDKVKYTIVVSNVGKITADVTLTDTLDKGLIFTGASGNYEYDSTTRTVTWNIDGLAVGQNLTFYVYATVDAYGVLNNTVTVGDNTVIRNVTVPEITPNKTVDNKNPNFGDNVTYTIVVSNDGAADAKNVVVKDILAPGFKFIEANYGGVYDELTRTVTWIVDVNAKDHVDLTIKVTVEDYGVLTNNVTVGNKTSSVNITVPEIIPNKTANIENPNFGDNVNYTVTVTNDGIGDAKDVVVRDILGEDLKFVSATGNYTFDEATRTVTWIVDLAKGESKVFSVIATVVGYGNVTNSLVVGNKTTGVNVTVPEINPDKTVDNEIPNFGDNVTYTVTVTNDGIGDANNVVITDVLDKGLKFLNATGNFTYDEKTGTITWTVDLAKGETKTFNVNVTVLGYGVLPNTVAVGNKTAVRNITVPEIITVKEVNSSDIHIGDEITYTITVSNPGKINAANVVIRDILPEGLKFINASNGGVYDSVTGIITWILNITANSTVDLTVDVCVNKSGNITNTVNVGNKTSNCTIESGDIVDLEIHIVADKSEIYVGDNVVYTVTVINNGPSDAINTIANILIPNALSILSYNATKGTFDITSGNWSIGNLTNGEKVVLTFVVKALNEGNSTVYVNVTSETFEVIMENNYDNVTVKVLKKAAPIGPDKQVHPDGSSSDNEGGKSVNLPNTGNPLVMLLLCILSVIFVGSRKRKL